jgi:hypothetical protein
MEAEMRTVYRDLHTPPNPLSFGISVTGRSYFMEKMRRGQKAKPRNRKTGRRSVFLFEKRMIRAWIVFLLAVTLVKIISRTKRGLN